MEEEKHASDSDGDTSIEDEFQDDKKEAKKAAKRMEGLDPEEHNVYDDDMNGIFEIVPPGEGDEFGAVKPWLGAIKEPESYPKPNPKPPKDNFKIDWVYGVRSEDIRQHVQFNAEGHACYPTAAIGVVYDYKNQKQLYFGGGKTDFGGRKQKNTQDDGHSDDVTALDISNSRKIIVSGQNGQKPIVCIWDAITAEPIGRKLLPKGSRLVTAISISPNDKYVVAADASEKIFAHIFKIDGSKNPIADIQIGMKVVHINYHPVNDNRFATAGAMHMSICDFDGVKTIKKNVGATGGQSQCSAAWINDQKYSDDVITGGNDGKLYHFTNNKQNGKAIANSKGPVQSVAARESKLGELVLAGGNDKTITVYKFEGKLAKLWSLALEAAPRSLDLHNEVILMALKNGSIVEMPMTADGKGTANIVMTSHCDGELWACECISFEDGSMRLITSSDDGRILCYDPITRKVLAEGDVTVKEVKDDGKKKKKKKAKKGSSKGGASTQAKTDASEQCRSIAYDSNQQHLAVANNLGHVTIRIVDWDLVNAGDENGFNKIKTTLFKSVKGAEWIEAMHYSPCGKSLAVGSHDNLIYVTDTKTYKKIRKLTGHSSFITSLDWSDDSKYIRTNCGAYELLFFNMSQAAKKERDPSGASNTVKTIWEDQTCKLGWNVQGIFPAGCDGSHINAVAMSKDRKLIASGDDYGLVCLYNNPLLEGHDCDKYRGHSEHVMNVRFSEDSKYLFSVGGQDQTCIQWKNTKK